MDRPVGAFLTAAYTVRATYLTFFGEPRGAAAGGDEPRASSAPSCRRTTSPHDVQQEGELEHELAGRHRPRRRGGPRRSRRRHGAHDAHGGHAVHGPHESPKLILSRSASSPSSPSSAGFTNATPFGEEWEQVQGVRRAPPGAGRRRPRPAAAEAGRRGAALPATRRGDEARRGRGARAAGLRLRRRRRSGTVCFFPAVSHAEFTVVRRPPLSLVDRRPPGWCRAGSSASPCTPGATAASSGSPSASRRPAAATPSSPTSTTSTPSTRSVIVHAIAHPIARAAYWVNQHVIDGVVNGVGRAGRSVGGWFYRNIDQGVVDGAVNGSGTVANETGDGAATRAVRQGQPVRRAAVRRRRRRRHRARDHQRVRLLEPHGRHLTDQNWLLSVGTFLPLVGVLAMLFIPRGEELLHQADRPRHGAGDVRRRRLHADPASTSTRPRSCSSSPTPSGSRPSAPTTRSASTGSACRCTCCRASSPSW